MVLRSHRDKTFPGTMVARLSVPWGNSHDDLGGYHLVWPREQGAKGQRRQRKLLHVSSTGGRRKGGDPIVAT
jgi:hypothetical protein